MSTRQWEERGQRWLECSAFREFRGVSQSVVQSGAEGGVGQWRMMFPNAEAGSEWVRGEMQLWGMCTVSCICSQLPWKTGSLIAI